MRRVRFRSKEEIEKYLEDYKQRGLAVTAYCRKNKLKPVGTLPGGIPD